MWTFGRPALLTFGFSGNLAQEDAYQYYCSVVCYCCHCLSQINIFFFFFIYTKNYLSTELATGDKWRWHGLFTTEGAGTRADKMVSMETWTCPLGRIQQHLSKRSLADQQNAHSAIYCLTHFILRTQQVARWLTLQVVIKFHENKNNNDASHDGYDPTNWTHKQH